MVAQAEGLTEHDFLGARYQPVSSARAQGCDAKAFATAFDKLQGAIAYTEGRQPTIEAPPPPLQGIGGERYVAYAIEIGKALFGRWGTVAGMLVEDLYKASQ